MRNFPNWIDAYLEYTTASEAPNDFHRWTAISTIAGALRRRVRLEMGLFRWFPNFYILFVSPPGIVSKTSTADLGMSLLRQVPGIRFGPNVLTWQKLVSLLAENVETFQDGPASMPMSALTFVASELGSLLQPGDQSMLNLLTDLWDGRDAPYLKATKKDGEELIENPWINLLGCTTPSWIAENFNSYFVGGGFASRILFIFAEHKRHLVAYPREILTKEHRQREEALVEDLQSIATLSGAFRLTSGAVRWGTEWYRDHHTSDNKLRLDSRFGGYFARKQTHLHKTAMVLSAAQRSDLTITEDDLRQADEWITALEPQMLEVFEGMGREKIAELMALVLTEVRRLGNVRKDHLYNTFLTKMGYTSFDECVTGLMQAGLVTLHGTEEGAFLQYQAGHLEQKVKRG